MTRTRPGSIIRKCWNGYRRQGSYYPAFIAATEYVVHLITRKNATTTQGYKIRSWIVVKE